MTASSKEAQATRHRCCQETHFRGSCYAVWQTTLRLGGSWPMEGLCPRTGLSRTLATLPKELVLCREAASRPDWVLLWFFHKKRHARPADGRDELTRHFLRGIWWWGKSLGVKPKCLGSNLSPNHLSICLGCLPGLPGPQSSHL